MNVMPKKWILAASMAVASTAVFAQKWEFKGLELGAKSSVAELESKFSLKCAPVAAPGIGQYCRGRTTFMEWPAELNVNLDADNYIFKISVPYIGDPLKQRDARMAVAEKFGQPTKQSGTHNEWVRKTTKSFWKITFNPSRLEMSVYRTDKPHPSNPALMVDPRAKKDL